jgi:hypothetical protein
VDPIAFEPIILAPIRLKRQAMKSIAITRIFLALMLLTPSLAGAQRAAKGTSATPGTRARRMKPVSVGHAVDHESFQITIVFRRSVNEKRVTDRSYTLLATTGETMPVIRDHYTYRASLTDTRDSAGHNIDVDIFGLERRGTSIYIALSVSTQGFVPDDSHPPPNLPVVTSTHRFLVTPTVPIGKLVTADAAAQGLDTHRDEIQVESDPLASSVFQPQ